MAENDAALSDDVKSATAATRQKRGKKSAAGNAITVCDVGTHQQKTSDVSMHNVRGRAGNRSKKEPGDLDAIERETNERSEADSRKKLRKSAQQVAGADKDVVFENIEFEKTQAEPKQTLVSKSSFEESTVLSETTKVKNEFECDSTVRPKTSFVTTLKGMLDNQTSRIPSNNAGEKSLTHNDISCGIEGSDYFSEVERASMIQVDADKIKFRTSESREKCTQGTNKTRQAKKLDNSTSAKDKIKNSSESGDTKLKTRARANLCDCFDFDLDSSPSTTDTFGKLKEVRSSEKENCSMTSRSRPYAKVPAKAKVPDDDTELLDHKAETEIEVEKLKSTNVSVSLDENVQQQDSTCNADLLFFSKHDINSKSNFVDEPETREPNLVIIQEHINTSETSKGGQMDNSGIDISKRKRPLTVESNEVFENKQEQGFHSSNPVYNQNSVCVDSARKKDMKNMDQGSDYRYDGLKPGFENPKSIQSTSISKDEEDSTVITDFGLIQTSTSLSMPKNTTRAETSNEKTLKKTSVNSTLDSPEQMVCYSKKQSDDEQMPKLASDQFDTKQGLENKNPGRQEREILPQYKRSRCEITKKRKDTRDETNQRGGKYDLSGFNGASERPEAVLNADMSLMSTGFSHSEKGGTDTDAHSDLQTNKSTSSTVLKGEIQKRSWTSAFSPTVGETSNKWKPEHDNDVGSIQASDDLDTMSLNGSEESSLTSFASPLLPMKLQFSTQKILPFSASIRHKHQKVFSSGLTAAGFGWTNTSFSASQTVESDVGSDAETESIAVTEDKPNVNDFTFFVLLVSC